MLAFPLGLLIFHSLVTISGRLCLVGMNIDIGDAWTSGLIRICVALYDTFGEQRAGLRQRTADFKKRREMVEFFYVGTVQYGRAGRMAGYEMDAMLRKSTGRIVLMLAWLCDCKMDGMAWCIARVKRIS
jgi:hypothetical protein